MDFYTEPERKIEIADRADVLVAGAGLPDIPPQSPPPETGRTLFWSNSSTASAEWPPAA